MAQAAQQSRLRDIIERYNDAWNAHDLDAITGMHAPDMVFENHTAGERAEGEQVREHIGRIFRAWPDIAFHTRRLYVRENLIVQEWTASATHESDPAPTTYGQKLRVRILRRPTPAITAAAIKSAPTRRCSSRDG